MIQITSLRTATIAGGVVTATTIVCTLLLTKATATTTAATREIGLRISPATRETLTAIALATKTPQTDLGSNQCVVTITINIRPELKTVLTDTKTTSVNTDMAVSQGSLATRARTARRNALPAQSTSTQSRRKTVRPRTGASTSLKRPKLTLSRLRTSKRPGLLSSLH